MSIRRRAIALRLSDSERKAIMERPIAQVAGPAKISRLGRYLAWRQRAQNRASPG